MTQQDELTSIYFTWMCDLVDPKRAYRKLLRVLFDTEFTYILPMDGNRYEDGIDLRYRFAYDQGVDIQLVASELDDKPCSVLEMAIALAIRLEEHIMSDPDIGDRTEEWFWDMMSNLGLKDMTDARFDECKVTDILRRFLDRDYKANGKGGLFVIKNPKRDLRDMEIWYQANWYLGNYV